MSHINGRFKKALIVDDDDVNNYISEQFIKQQDVSDLTHVTFTGEEAIDYLEACEKDKDETFPDLILVDISMPVMSGFEFLEHYERKFWKRNKATRIVVVTSSVRDDDARKAQGFASVNKFLVKPVTDFTQFLAL